MPKNASLRVRELSETTAEPMPEISRFFGIVIRMFVEAGGPHNLPHFHAYYQDHVVF